MPNMELPDRPAGEASASVGRRRRRRRRFLLAAFVLALVLLACAVPMARRMLKRPPDPIPIAIVMPLSGPQGREGEMMVNAVQLYFDEVNRRGGVQGRPLTVLAFDDEGKPAVAAARAKEVAAGPAVAVIGHFSSSTSVPAGPVYKEARLPAITATANTDLLTVGNPYYFRLTFDTAAQGSALAAYAMKVLGINKASVLFSNEDYGRSLLASFEDAYPEEKGTLRYKWAWNPAATPAEQAVLMRQVANDVAYGDAGVVILAISPYTAAKDAVCLLRRNGADPILLGGSALGNQFSEFFRDEPEEKSEPGFFTNNLYCASPIIFDSASDRGLAFIDLYEKAYGQRPASRAAKHYEAAQLIAEALQRAGVALTAQSRDEDRQKIRDWLATQRSSDNALQGLTGPLYFDEDQTLPQPVRIGRFVEGRFVSAPIQLQAIPNPALIDLDRELAAGHVIRIDQRFYWFQRVVYTGIDVNQVGRVDPSKGTFSADFYLWFRYAGDDQVLEVDLNAATEKSPYDPKTPLLAKEIDGLKYRLYRVKGEFKSTFDFHDYPFDEQSLMLRLANPHLTREQAIYAIDTFGLRLPRPHGGVSELRPLANWNFTAIRYIPDTLRSTSTRGHPGAFHGEFETEFSGFDVAIGVQRKALVFVVKTLLPLLLLVLVVYTTLHFPVSLTKERLTIAISAMLASAVLLTAINLQLTDVGYTTAIEYGFYAFFTLCLCCVITGLTVERLHASKRHASAARFDVFARIAYVLVMLGVFAGYVAKYGTL